MNYAEFLARYTAVAWEPAPRSCALMQVASRDFETLFEVALRQIGLTRGMRDPIACLNDELINGTSSAVLQNSAKVQIKARSGSILGCKRDVCLGRYRLSIDHGAIKK